MMHFFYTRVDLNLSGGLTGFNGAFNVDGVSCSYNEDILWTLRGILMFVLFVLASITVTRLKSYYEVTNVNKVTVVSTTSKNTEKISSSGLDTTSKKAGWIQQSFISRFTSSMKNNVQLRLTVLSLLFSVVGFSFVMSEIYAYHSYETSGTVGSEQGVVNIPLLIWASACKYMN
jgi:hypothetical protein